MIDGGRDDTTIVKSFLVEDCWTGLRRNATLVNSSLASLPTEAPQSVHPKLCGASYKVVIVIKVSLQSGIIPLAGICTLQKSEVRRDPVLLPLSRIHLHSAHCEETSECGLDLSLPERVIVCGDDLS